MASLAGRGEQTHWYGFEWPTKRVVLPTIRQCHVGGGMTNVPDSFRAVQNPSDAACAQLEDLAPTVPYYTKEYRDAVRRYGSESWLIGVGSSDSLEAGCLGEVRRGRFSSELRIQSTPTNAGPEFWAGLSAFCKDQRVTHLNLKTICTSPDIPSLGAETLENQRFEYWVDLTAENLKGNMRGEQRRVFNRATDAGMELHVAPLDEGLDTHNRLTNASLSRRRDRGEHIPFFEDSEIPRALIESGVARIYEAHLNGEVHGSVIMTIARDGAHGYSAGFGPEGLKSGAGVFINFSTFCLLKEEGKSVFNLGDAPEGSGLAMFKRGLGGVVHESRAVQVLTGTRFQRTTLAVHSKLRSALAAVRQQSSTR